ncbi:hypothetical protein N9574_00625 [bacterium]|jgi:hypothetical protein|nr:hypothetical protein [bacterium]MDB4109737.1 hypothetical protein [bacterium]|tara:strand:- start:53 stop:358 length:306 start_codon:yes stop_codon:yes gene_type:complete
MSKMLVLAIQFSRTRNTTNRTQIEDAARWALADAVAQSKTKGYRAAKAIDTTSPRKRSKTRRPLKTEDRNRNKSKFEQSNKLYTQQSIVVEEGTVEKPVTN